MGYLLTPDELAATQEKIDAINAKAAKKGLSGRLEVNSTEITVKSDIAGIEVSEIRFETTITGEPPKHNGWVFLASLDWVETSNGASVIVNAAPGAPTVDRDALELNKCDHCGINRYRKGTYVVKNETTGEQLQVGSSCIKDFLGWSGTVAFISEDDCDREISGICGSGTVEYTTESVLAVAWACVTTFGYIRSGEPGSTRDAVSEVMYPVENKRNRAIKERIRPVAAEALSMAQKLREFILSNDFWGDSDYVLNLKTFCAAEWVSPRYLGYLASVPQAYAKHLERTFIKQRKQDALVNEWVGEPADKLTLKVKVVAVRWIEDNYNPYGGSKPLYTMVSDTGHTFKWFASRDAFGEDVTPEGEDFFTIKATVKKHEEWNELKSTVLTRCKKV